MAAERSGAALDTDPNARKQEKTVTVKLLAEQQPVLPPGPEGVPFTPVEFDGLTVTPYVDDRTKRLTYSVRATGVRAPSQGTQPQTTSPDSSAGTTDAASGAKEPVKETAREAGKDPGKDEAAKSSAKDAA